MAISVKNVFPRLLSNPYYQLGRIMKVLLAPLLTLVLALSDLSWPSIWKKIYSGFWKQFWKPKFWFTINFVKSSWKSGPQTYIVVSPTWNTITFVSNVKSILLPLELKVLTTYFLLLHSFVTTSTFNSNNISGSKIALFQSSGTDSKCFFKKVWNIPGPL